MTLFSVSYVGTPRIAGALTTNRNLLLTAGGTPWKQSNPRSLTYTRSINKIGQTTGAQRICCYSCYKTVQNNPTESHERRLASASSRRNVVSTRCCYCHFPAPREHCFAHSSGRGLFADVEIALPNSALMLRALLLDRSKTAKQNVSPKTDQRRQATVNGYEKNCLKDFSDLYYIAYQQLQAKRKCMRSILLYIIQVIGDTIFLSRWSHLFIIIDDFWKTSIVLFITIIHLETGCGIHIIKYCILNKTASS